MKSGAFDESFSRLTARTLWFLVWIGLGVYLALTLWWSWMGATYPYQLDYGEGIVLWFARQLASGHSIYKGLVGLPYASSNYPPVAMLLSAALMPIVGDGYVGGRLLNIVAAFLVAALIYRIVRVESGRRWVGLLAALFFVGSPYVYDWIALFRVDLIGLAFAFAGIYAVWVWERGKRHPALLVAAGACFLLAGYTKQTLFAAPAAAFLALWSHDKRAAVLFGGILAAAAGAIYLAVDWATGGGFTFGVLESNATVFLPQQLLALLGNFATTFPILIMLGIWALVTRLRQRQFGVLEWYAIISALSLVMAGRMGAWENYFFEAIAALCVIAPSHWYRTLGNMPGLQSLVPPILLLLQICLMWHDPRIAANLVAKERPANEQLAALLERTGGPVISEDMGALVTSGKPVDYYTYQYSSLARSGKWDQSWELNNLKQGMFPLVILENGTREDVDHYRRFTREFLSTLDEYYARVESIGKYEIYAPAPLENWSSPPQDFGGTIALVGWSMLPEDVQSGTLRLDIVWQAKRPMMLRYTAFVHLQDASGNKIAQRDREPLDGVYPTNRWGAGEMVRDTYTLKIPDGLAPGQYSLQVGWYEPDSGDRLIVPGSPDNTFLLASFKR